MASAGAKGFKSIKSLPVDYRFSGLPEKNTVSNSSVISISIPENGSGNMDKVVDDDSPYGQNDRPSIDDEDINPSVSPQGSVLASWGNKRWGDTASYVAKKVNFVFKLQFLFVIN